MESLLNWSALVLAALIAFRAIKGDLYRGVYAVLVPLGWLLTMAASSGDGALSVQERIVFTIGMGVLIGGVLGVCLYRKPTAARSGEP